MALNPPSSQLLRLPLELELEVHPEIDALSSCWPRHFLGNWSSISSRVSGLDPVPILVAPGSGGSGLEGVGLEVFV